jgi:hypothetical protein
VGEMTTPELLAKREQRRRMEAQAAALSRPSLSRRLLQPLHNQPQLQQQPAPSSGQQQAARSVFSRAGLKRPAPAAKAAAPPPGADPAAGISAEDLAKVRAVVALTRQPAHAERGCCCKCVSKCCAAVIDMATAALLLLLPLCAAHG